MAMIVDSLGVKRAGLSREELITGGSELIRAATTQADQRKEVAYPARPAR